MRHLKRARRRWTGLAQLAGVAVLVLSVPLTMLEAHAAADTLTNSAVTLTDCQITSGSETVTVSSTADLTAGMSVVDSTTASNIPAGTTIGSVVDTTELTLSQDAAGTSSVDTLVFGNVTLTTEGTVTADTPYSSGQVISVSVAPNSTLAGDSSVEVWECSDYDGLVANLPTSAENNCDGNTTIKVTAINANGSIPAFNYTIYALPDSYLFGESSGSLPECGLAPNYCVLYIGSSTGFAAGTYMFSAPFVVSSNADDGGENPGDGEMPAQTSTSSTLSTVVASPITNVADGVSASSITITLEDTSDNPVTGGKEVTLTQPSSDHSEISCDGSVQSTCETNASTGVVVFSVSDSTVEDVTYTATDVTDSVTLATTPSVSFEAPMVTATNCSLTATPTSVPSGGSSTVTVTLEDQGTTPQPVAGKTVELTATGGSSTITPVSPTTNSEGQATFSVADTMSETVTYTATDTTDDIPITGQSVEVTFGTLTVSGSNSTVTANENTVSSASSNGVPTSTAVVTVTLIAPDGHSVVSGKTVTLSASSPNAVIKPTTSPDVTGSNGQATFTVGDATSESVTFSAEDSTDDIAIAQTVTIDFEAPTASATTSSVSVTPSTLPADGVTPATIDVTVRDQFGNPISGVAVSVTGNPSATTRVAPQTESTNVPAGTTGVGGTAVFYAYDTTAETVTYTATDTTDNVVISQTVQVTFQATAPQADNSTLSADPSNVPADGTTSATITVTLEDHNSNPVAGKAIVLTAASGNSVITPISPTTNAQGQATFGVTDITNEVVTYTATDTTDNLPLAGQAVTVTFGTPPPVTPVIADSTIVAQPTSVPADGTSTATISVVLSDANGDALAGKTVALNPSGGNSSVTTVTGVTNSDGTATFTVSDRTVEDVTYSATDVTDDLPLTGVSATVDFTTPPAGSSSTPSSTSGTTPSASGASTTSSTPAAASGSASSTSSTATAGASLAFTGTPNVLPWMMAIGGLLMLIGSLGRRRVGRARPASGNAENR